MRYMSAIGSVRLVVVVSMLLAIYLIVLRSVGDVFISAVVTLLVAAIGLAQLLSRQSGTRRNEPTGR